MGDAGRNDGLGHWAGPYHACTPRHFIIIVMIICVNSHHSETLDRESSFVLDWIGRMSDQSEPSAGMATIAGGRRYFSNAHFQLMILTNQGTTWSYC
ncbi:polyketide synthase [Anopheles sinensis]|uniref:Polyketide synthase n=1 Tax=Anopheles sinensis TaxID=74873 RepID=A0A084WHL5_ANOSI|nr:polyketide synthase [Anopheles sinensis]